MTGRYLTPDPISLDGGINPFLYAEANPVNYIDPDGLNAIWMANPAITGGFGVGATGINNQATASDYIQAGKFLKDTSFLHLQALAGLHVLMADNLSGGDSEGGEMSGGTCPNGDDDDPNNKKLTKTQWGWRGSKNWRAEANKVDNGGNITNLSGKILRIEGPHKPPNPHTYKHINYLNKNGVKSTIKIR